MACSPAHIHDLYIADGDWRESLWSGMMTLLGRSGDTLVDIVSDLWTMTANAITAVKAGVTEFVEGVKAGLDYFANNSKCLPPYPKINWILKIQF